MSVAQTDTNSHYLRVHNIYIYIANAIRVDRLVICGGKYIHGTTDLMPERW